jgi:O-antigen/teichoic acid export membrane protein
MPPTSAISDIHVGTQTGGILRLHWARSVFGNTAAMFVARVLTTLSQVLAFAIVEKAYGTNALDRYAVAFAVATFVGLALDFGTSTWATREVAQSHTITAGVRARLPMLGLVILGLCAAVATQVLSAGEAVVIVLTGVLLSGSYLAKGVFMGQRMHDREMVFAAAESFGLVVLLAGAYLKILPHLAPLIYTAVAYAGGATGRWLTMPSDTKASIGARGTPWSFAGMVPYGAQNIVMMASAQLDVLLLAAFWTAKVPGAIAAYALAMRVYYAAPMLLDALGSALLPRFVHQPGRYRRVAIQGTVAGSIVAASAAGLFAWVAPLFGYSTEIVRQLRLALLILACSFFARCGAYVLGALVTAQGGQRARLLSASASLAVMVALDLILIPAQGLVGAAWALVVADWVQVGGYALGAWRVVVAPRHPAPLGVTD